MPSRTLPLHRYTTNTPGRDMYHDDGPAPLSAMVSHSQTIDGVDSHISRVFDPRDKGACTRCPFCSMDERTGHCQVKVNRFVHEDDAALFSVTRFLRDGG